MTPNGSKKTLTHLLQAWGSNLTGDDVAVIIPMIHACQNWAIKRLACAYNDTHGSAVQHGESRVTGIIMAAMTVTNRELLDQNDTICQYHGWTDDYIDDNGEASDELQWQWWRGVQIDLDYRLLRLQRLIRQLANTDREET